MPRIQVYIPEPLYERVKARSDRLNVSSILRRALEQALAELERQDALDKGVRAHEARNRRFTAAELERQLASDARTARRPRIRERPTSAV
jgi:post-segregation antitoxin (ccd killing protein)